MLHLAFSFDFVSFMTAIGHLFMHAMSTGPATSSFMHTMSTGPATSG